MSSLDVANEQSNMTGTFVNEAHEINKKSSFLVSDLKGNKNEKKLVGAKVGDVISLQTKKLFNEEQKLGSILGVSPDLANNLDVAVSFTVEEITKTIPADLDKELFDKLFADGSVNSVTALREKIKEDAEKQFQQQGDQQLLNAVIEHLVATTKCSITALNNC